jgi:CubicO group peptidase (beta-lactamase class C family)
MTRDTIFDLASLTKPLATTLAVMKLVAQKKIRLDQSLESILLPFKNTEKSKITVKHLLRHDSGLSDYRPYYKALRNLVPKNRKKALRDFLVQEPLVYPVGQRMLYSDLGFMILSWIVEQVSGKRLDRFVTDEIYRPIGLGLGSESGLFFVGLDSVPGTVQFAATECCPWRNILLDGRVHDDNAYAAGGVEGHAGLFGTAGSIYTLLSTLLSVFHGGSSTGVFEKELVHTFFECRKNSDKALGFDTPSAINASCGRYFSKKSVGHLGFTGTSFWMDLDRCIIVILLTNRVHPSRNNNKIKTFRPKLHDMVMQHVLSIGVFP